MTDQETAFRELIKNLPEAEGDSEVKSSMEDLVDILGYDKENLYYDLPYDSQLGSVEAAIKAGSVAPPQIIFIQDYSEHMIDSGYLMMGEGGEEEEDWYEQQLDHLLQKSSARYVVYMANDEFIIYSDHDFHWLVTTMDLKEEAITKAYDLLKPPNTL